MSKKDEKKKEKPPIDWTTDGPTRIEHNGITVELQKYEYPRRLRDDTWAHPVRIVSRATMADLDKLVGMELCGLPVTGYLPEVATHNQTGYQVGLVIAEKKW